MKLPLGRPLTVGALATLLLSTSTFAALKPGDPAPVFKAKASLGGKDFTFTLKKALKKGPVVLYFYPSAFTGGCDLEAHTFASEKAKFEAAGATILGVSADNLERLNSFAADPDYCAGKFPVASDPDGKVAASFDLAINPPKDGAKDVRGIPIGHGFIPRVTFVIARDGKIAATLSSSDDHLTPPQHVEKSLEVVERLNGGGPKGD